jgi:predicted enzyme related to lactoylglutathione lyase
MTPEATAPASSAADAIALETRAVVISLTAKDLLETVAWYRDVLGFNVEYQMDRDGKPSSASVRSGVARVVLNQDDGGRGWERVKGEGFAITFETVQDVDAIAARIKARGGKITMEPSDMPWGVRMLRVVDPDGYRLGIWRPLATS